MYLPYSVSRRMMSVSSKNDELVSQRGGVVLSPSATFDVPGDAGLFGHRSQRSGGDVGGQRRGGRVTAASAGSLIECQQRRQQRLGGVALFVILLG